MVCSRGESPTHHNKHTQMTNNTNIKVAKTSIVKQAFTAVAFAAAPFAIVFGIAAVNAPSAEAYSSTCYTNCYGYSCTTTCF